VSSRNLTAFALALLLPLGACSDDSSGRPDANDVSREVGADSDVARDSGFDAGPDTGPDAGHDAGQDSDGPSDALEGHVVTVGSAVIDTRVPEIRLEHDGDVLLRFDVSGLQVGLVSTISEAESYDPYGFFLDDDFLHPPPPLDGWAELQSMDYTGESGGAHSFDLEFEGGATATLRVVDGAGGPGFLLIAQVEAGAVAYYRLRPLVDPTEGFYGLGEWFDRPEHRDTVRAMQLEIDADLESANNEAHVPVPFITGTTGWGLFVESFYPGVFDVAAAAADRVDVVFGTGSGSSAGLRFHLYAADHPLDVTRGYYETTGYPVRPAPWALGPWIWRDENDDQAQVISDANTIRDLDLATSAYWIDRPYASGVNSFDWNPDQFDDPQGMIDTLHDLGLRVALWSTPYLDSEDEATAALYAEAERSGFFPPTVGLLLNNWGPMIDLTDPDAFEWWQGLISRYTDMGIEGFKLDYGEDIAVGPLGGRNLFEFDSGADERTMQSRYQLLYHRAYAELLPETGGFLLCRGGTFGDQRNVSVVWPGDLDANFARHREVVDDGDESYVAVGGIPAALSAALSLGPSGFPLFASDTGGYRHAPPDKETFTRWFQMSALAPVMQVGTNSNDVAWEFNERNGFDEEMLGWYREYTRLHLRLWPYFWTLIDRLAADGRPIQRAFGLAWPELGLHPGDVYALGDDLLVAPVIERGARTRTLPLPPGEWVDWWTGERHSGPGEITVDAPLATLPLFLRAGGMVPMLRPTIDTLSPTTEPERVDSYATDPGVLYVLGAPGEPTTVELFDGTRLVTEETEGGFAVVSQDGDAFDSGLVLTLIGMGDFDGTVTLDGDPLDNAEWSFDRDDRSGALSVDVPAGGHRIEVAF